MKRIVTEFVAFCAMLFGSSSYLPAQSLTAESFLKGVSSRPVGDQVEVEQGGKVYQALTTDSPAEAQRELPSILQYALEGNEVHARKYATLFLTAIAIRPDGAALLFPSSGEIASLLLDADPGIQRGALAVAFWAGPDQQPYVSAFEEAVERTQTPQDTDVQMVSSLAKIGSSDSDALNAVLDFMHRDDLTVSTRIDLVHFLGNLPDLPNEINQTLVKELDDPDPRVRAAAVAAFSDSTTTAYHTLAKPRVESMANDPHENPQVRELAKEAIAGKTHLSPNINLPPDKLKDH
jgi:HEAT repeat protein